MCARQRPPAPLASLSIAMLLLASCSVSSQPTGRPGQANVAAALGVTETVGAGGVCVPDLTDMGVRVAAPRQGAATGVIVSPVSAEQVRLGTVPPPPDSHVVATGKAAGTTGAPFANQQFVLYETGCAPVAVQTFYVAILRQNQWNGDFNPASGTDIPLNRPQPETGPTVVLADLADFTSGAFINVNPASANVAFINVLGAIVAPGTGPSERHPTYVQIVTQQTRNPQAPSLAPNVDTTPDVGASGGPPNAVSTYSATASTTVSGR
jgi:hypothetical protein